MIIRKFTLNLKEKFYYQNVSLKNFRKNNYKKLNLKKQIIWNNYESILKKLRNGVKNYIKK